MNDKLSNLDSDTMAVKPIGDAFCRDGYFCRMLHILSFSACEGTIFADEWMVCPLDVFRHINEAVAHLLKWNQTEKSRNRYDSGIFAHLLIQIIRKQRLENWTHDVRPSDLRVNVHRDFAIFVTSQILHRFGIDRGMYQIRDISVPKLMGRHIEIKGINHMAVMGRFLAEDGLYMVNHLLAFLVTDIGAILNRMEPCEKSQIMFTEPLLSCHTDAICYTS